MPLLRRCELPMAYSPTQTHSVHTALMNRNPVSIWRLWLPRFPQSFFQPLSDKHTHVLPLFSLLPLPSIPLTHPLSLSLRLTPPFNPPYRLWLSLPSPPSFTTLFQPTFLQSCQNHSEIIKNVLAAGANTLLPI